MSERPTEIVRLDALLGDAPRVGRQRADSAEQDLLLGESARIVTEGLPGLTAAARELAGKWSEQSLLDPNAAETTLGELAEEFERIESDVEALLDRQRQIAARVSGDAGAVGLRRGEASGGSLLVAIGQGKRRVAEALDVGLCGFGAKLLGAGGELLRSAGSLRLGRSDGRPGPPDVRARELLGPRSDGPAV